MHPIDLLRTLQSCRRHFGTRWARTVAVRAGWRNYIYVLIDTDRGATGLGEASLGGKPALSWA